MNYRIDGTQLNASENLKALFELLSVPIESESDISVWQAELSQRLTQIDKDNNVNHWSADQYRRLFESNYCLYLIRVEDQKSESKETQTMTDVFNSIVGFCLFQCALDEAELLNMVIDKSSQNQGLGKKLLKYAMNQLQVPKNSSQENSRQEKSSQGDVRKFYLEVRADNHSAIGLYQGLGFAKVGFRKNYYKPHEHNEMERALGLHVCGVVSRDAIIMAYE